jgi:hypothetical protein
LRTLASSA